MITTFFSMMSVIVTIFGLLLPMLSYTMKAYKDAEQKGYNPMFSSFLYLFVGYGVGLTITSLFLSMVAYIGFPVQYFNCLFLYGNSNQCANVTNTSQQTISTWNSMDNSTNGWQPNNNNTNGGNTQ